MAGPPKHLLVEVFIRKKPRLKMKPEGKGQVTLDPLREASVSTLCWSPHELNTSQRRVAPTENSAEAVSDVPAEVNREDPHRKKTRQRQVGEPGNSLCSEDYSSYLLWT